ncbi:hypothetical protein [Streptomyces monomycini]|uniref:hypothetical protein n=1 Tax=Streptomyces monomycini TaxID=371720 RepID=UPI0004AB52AC|nr:hypothetical protein [Streptomyces monomycini]
MTAPSPAAEARPKAPARRLCPHPLRAEARGSIAPWAGLVVFLSLAAALAAKADRWQGNWGETSLELHAAATLLGGPLAAAIGCWHGGRERRSRTADLRLSAARSPLAQFVVAALPVVVAVVLGYVLAAAGTLLASAPYVSAGRLLVLPVVADAVFLAATVAVAMVVGRLVRWRPVAAAMAGLTYLALALPRDRDSTARFLSPAVNGGVGEALPVWWQPVVMAGWTGGLAVAAVAYAARRAHGRWVALVPLAVAVCAAVVLVQAGDRAWRPDPAAGRQVCDGGSPAVCVNALEADLLPQVSQALSGVTGRLAGVPNAPVRFEDLPRETHRDEAQLPQLFRGQSVVRGRLADPERFAWEAAAGLAGGRDCGGTDPFLRVDEAVRDWLVSNGLSERRRAFWARNAREGGDKEAVAAAEAGERALRHLASMDDERRRAWLGRYFRSVESCDARKVPQL